MGTINGNHEVIVHEMDNLLWGNNEFETGVLSIADGDSATDGTVLTRDETSGKYKMATDTTNPLFVLVDRSTFNKAGDYPVRVCISGRLNRKRLTLDGEALTVAQADALRTNGILALPSVSYGSGDNE